MDYILLNFLDETSQEIQTIVNDYLNITKHLLSKIRIIMMFFKDILQNKNNFY